MVVLVIMVIIVIVVILVILVFMVIRPRPTIFEIAKTLFLDGWM
jgi:hypothetical protein